MASQLHPISVQQAIPEIERDIRRCLRAFGTEPLGNIEAEIRRIGEEMAEIRRRVPSRSNDTELLEDLQSLQSDYRCLMTRASIVAKKQPSVSHSILEILNTPPLLDGVYPRLDASSFEKLLSSLTQRNANTRFFVVDEWTGHQVIKHYALATPEQIAAQGRPSLDVELSPLHNQTTTLANIILTNELGFTPRQVEALVRKLIDVKADFSAVDYTRSRVCDALQNNAFKNMIALGSSTTHYDKLLESLIQHISSLPEAEMHKIFDHLDLYHAHLSPISFLIRQGKEDLALLMVGCGAHVGEKDLLMACQSFGTTSVERPVGIPLVEGLYEALIRQNRRISPKTLDECLSALKFATPEMIQLEKERLRRENLLQKWGQDAARNYEGHQSKQVKKRLGLDFADLKTLFAQALNGDQDLFEWLLHTYAEELIVYSSYPELARGIFHDEYRTPDRDDKLLKYTYVSSVEGQAKLAELISLIESSLREESKASSPAPRATLPAAEPSRLKAVTRFIWRS